jgi:hypothetical protein
VLANEVNDAPATISLSYVPKRERRPLRPSEATAQEDGQYRAVAQALYRRRIRRAEQRLLQR